MRIISNFKDYYDSCLAYGSDKSLIYTRKEKKQNLNKVYSYSNDLFYQSDGDKGQEYVSEIKRFMVGFCGNLYPALHVVTRIGPSESFCVESGNRSKSFIVYSVEEFKELFPGFYNRERTWRIHGDYKGEIDLWLNDSSWSIWGCVKKIEVEAYKKLFIDRKIPIFRVDQYKQTEITENCNLQGCGFHKVLDAFQTFQEISMYVADSLCDKEDPEMPVGNDVIVARSKGYDDFSFRQDKGSKKGKRKFNKARKRNQK